MVRCVIALLIVGRYRTCRNRWGMPQGQQVAQRQCDQGHGARADTGWRDRRVPNEGEHDTMKTARDPGSHSASPGRLLPLVSALALFSTVGGCAGWSSLGENGTVPTKRQRRRPMTFTPMQGLRLVPRRQKTSSLPAKMQRTVARARQLRNRHPTWQPRKTRLDRRTPQLEESV